MWALCTGDWASSLGVAVFFELFWLDLFPAGTFIPPQSVASTFTALALINYFELVSPAQYALPLMLSIPMALLGSRLEFYQRKVQDAGYNSLLQWARCAESARASSPGRLIAISLAQVLVMNFVFFCLGLLALVGVLSFLLEFLGPEGTNLPLGWGHLWFVGALGGLLSLRVSRSYAAFGLGVAVIVLLAML